MVGVDPGMTELIERYLRSRGARYFRGHHDDEYFFLVDVPAGANRGRLHVHLGVGADRGEVVLVITPDRYYPGARRERIATVALDLAALPRADPAALPTWDDCADQLLRLYRDTAG
jgi:hypothetical protein